VRRKKEGRREHSAPEKKKEHWRARPVFCDAVGVQAESQVKNNKDKSESEQAILKRPGADSRRARAYRLKEKRKGVKKLNRKYSLKKRRMTEKK